MTINPGCVQSTGKAFINNLKNKEIKNVKNKQIKNKSIQFTGKPHLNKSKLGVHNKFHAHLFQYFGSKGIVQLCLRYDLCNAQANTSIFSQFLWAYHVQLNSPEHMAARKISEKRDEQHVRLSRRIYQMRLRLKEGARLQCLLDEGITLYQELSDEQKETLNMCGSGYYEFNNMRFVSSLEHQMVLLKQQQEPRGQKYPSAGSAASILLEGHEGGNAYRPERRNFNLFGKGKSKKGKGKGKLKQ